MITPSRVTLARKRRRLTGRELARRSGLSHEHLSRIECGKAENVERHTVEALAAALNFPADFFSGDDVEIPPLDSVSFRSLSAMSAKERDAALSAGGMAFLVSDWVAERFNLPEIDLLDLRFEKEPESAARSLRSYWGLGEKPISNVIKLLESKGVRVFSLAEETRNVDAYSCWRNNIPYIFLNTYKSAERSRFDALHELGHLVLHRHGKPQGREAEAEADQFASFFLMPYMDLLGNVPRRITALNQLINFKKRWGVSVAALAYRLHKSGVLSDWQYRNFCIQINQEYAQSEPQGLPRERSVVLEKIFRELWKERATRDHVAKELRIPSQELDGLVFNLVGIEDAQGNKPIEGRPKLRLA